MVRYANYGNMVDEPSGAWVLFTDAQAKSLADERRIKEADAKTALALGDNEQLRIQLSAERTRRLKAEEVVDLLLVPVVIEDDLPELIQEAEGYRAQYPRVEEKT